MKYFFTLLFIAISGLIFSQVEFPESFDYQAILRNSSGNIRANTNVSIDIAILKGSATGSQVFIETHSVTTNAYGLVNLKIGSKNTSGFALIDWADGPFFVKISVDGTEMGTSQLLSVPYALYAKRSADAFSGDYNDLANKPDIPDNTSDLTNGAGFITSYIETDPKFSSSPSNNITSSNINNWNAAFSWGNHSGLYKPFNYVPNWSDILNKPTTISGYGITDAVTINTAQTVSGVKTFSSSINVNGNTITNVKTPVNPNDAANKAYVDQLLERIEELEATSSVFWDERDNHYYKQVKIGNQIWMAENLAYLPTVTSPSLQSYTEPYIYVYGYSGSNVWEAKSTFNYQKYGVLYNWPAAMNGANSSNSNPSGVQGVCPSGWHIPSDSEYKELEAYLGMSAFEIENSYWRGTDEGGKLKATGTSYWFSPNTGATNSSGFTALPGGRYYDGLFEYMGQQANFLTTTQDEPAYPDYFQFRILSNEEARIRYVSVQKRAAYSIRCVKD